MPSFFLSVMALVLVTTATMIAVRNRVRLKSVTEISSSQSSRMESQNSRQNAKLSALVTQLNENADAVNQRAKDVDRRIERLDKRERTQRSNDRKQADALRKITNANFMGMNNRMTSEFARLDAMDDHLTSTITKDRMDRMSNDNALNNRIQAHEDVYNDFIENSYAPFVSVTRENVASNQMSIRDLDQAYKSADRANYDALNTRINQTRSDMTSEMSALRDTFNSNVLEGANIDEQARNALMASIDSQQQNFRTNLNSFFDNSNVVNVDTGYISTTFDEYLSTKYYNSGYRSGGLQDTINRVEQHAYMWDSQQVTNANYQAQLSALHNTSNQMTGDIRYLMESTSNQDSRITNHANKIYALENSNVYHESMISTLMDSANSYAITSNDMNAFKTATSGSIAAIQATLDDHNNLISRLYRMSNDSPGVVPSPDPESVPTGGSPIDLIGVTPSSIYQYAQQYFDDNINEKVRQGIDERFDQDPPVTNSLLDSVFSQRVLNYNVRMDGVTATNMAASNLTVNGDTNTNNVRASGDFIIPTNDAETPEMSLRNVYDDITGVKRDITINKSKFDNVFALEDNLGDAFVINPGTINLNTLNKVTMKHDTELIKGKSLTLSEKNRQGGGKEGGRLIVDSFDNIGFFDGNNNFNSLQSRLDGTTSGGLDVSSLNNKRVNVLYTEPVTEDYCTVNATENKCKPIGTRLNNLESSVAALQSPSGSPPADSPPGGGSIDLTPFDPNSMRTFAAIDGGREISFGSSGLNVEAPIRVSGDDNVQIFGNGTFTINKDVEIDGKLTANNEVTMDRVDVDELNVKNTFKVGGETINGADLKSAINTITENPITDYVKDITYANGRINISHGNPDKTPNAVNINLNSLPGMLTEYERKSDVSNPYTQYTFGGTSDSGFQNKKELNHPHNVVTNVSLDSNKINVTTMDTNDGSSADSSIELPELNKVNNHLRNGMLILGNTAIQAADGKAQVCKYNSGTVTDCVDMWDKRQAPEPVQGSAS
jgi:hypothetical protein